MTGTSLEEEEIFLKVERQCWTFSYFSEPVLTYSIQNLIGIFNFGIKPALTFF